MIELRVIPSLCSRKKLQSVPYTHRQHLPFLFDSPINPHAAQGQANAIITLFKVEAATRRAEEKVHVAPSTPNLPATDKQKEFLVNLLNR